VSYYPQNNGYPNNSGMQMQPQMQLPVNPTQITNQPVNVSPGQPHFIPAVNVPQQIQQYIPLITSVIIMEIQNKMQQNPLRVFMFNLYSMNQYNNREFTELVEICSNYIHLVMMNGREYNSIEGAVLGVVQNVVTMMACAQIKPFPSLMQLLQPDLQQSAVNGTRALETIVRDITASTRQQGGYNTQMPVRSGMGGAVPTMAGVSEDGYGLFGQANRQSFPQNNIVNASHSSGGAINRYKKQLSEQNTNSFNTSHQYSSTPVQQTAPSQFSGKSSARATVADLMKTGSIQQPFVSREPAVVSEATFSPNARASQPTSVMNTQPNDWFNNQVTGESIREERKVTSSYETTVYSPEALPSGMKWERSDKQPYHPIWNPTIQKPMYTVVDGACICVLIDLSEEEKGMMEYEKHLVGRRPVNQSVSESTQDNIDGKIVNIISKPFEVTVVEDTSGSMIATCSEAAVSIARLKAKQDEYLSSNDACIVKMTVVTPLFVDTRELEEELRTVVLLLSSSKTFSEGLEIIKDMSSDGKIHLLPFIDKILVDSINSVLSLEMGLDNVTIDSFNDTLGLSTALSQAFGDTVGNSLEAEEESIMHRLLLLGKEDTAMYVKGVIGDSWGNDYKNGTVAFSAADMAYICLKLHSRDINLADTGNRTVLVTEAGNKELFAILTKSLGAIQKGAYQIYMVTTDNVVMQVTNGFINKEAILVRRV
jgi:hypothetical protein